MGRAGKEGNIHRLGRLNLVYRAIQLTHEEKGYAISLLCVIAEVERTGYHRWVKHEPTAQEAERKWLTETILHTFHELKGIYGYRRLTREINRTYQKNYNPKRIRRIMRLLGLRSVIRRAKKRYVHPSQENVQDNRLARQFSAAKPNEKWVTDITEMKCSKMGQKLYLSAVKDLFDNSIVAYRMSASNNNQLVLDTLRDAISQNEVEGTLIHSDRGFQYTSNDYRDLTTEAKMVVSMSRVGHCIDNGPMESFWGILKAERYHLHDYQTYAELEADIHRYILFYNERRLQEKFNSLTPMEYRRKAVA